jgi:protein-tyrosine phosphatase
VNCAAGLNRSGLIVGRALIALGYEPHDAIRRIRAARGPRALFNRTFEEFLLLDWTERVGGVSPAMTSSSCVSR